MKDHLLRQSLVVLATIYLLVLLCFIRIFPSKQLVSEIPAISELRLGLPVRLIIPAINVDAGVQYLGVTSTGEMEVPNNIMDVGWFRLGPGPGENGSAIIAGHFNGNNNEAGVFTNLHKLKAGDKLYVIEDSLASLVFVVKESRIYDLGHADDIFNFSNQPHLNLITCYGTWDKSQKSYTKRLVVFADIDH